MDYFRYFSFLCGDPVVSVVWDDLFLLLVLGRWIPARVVCFGIRLVVAYGFRGILCLARAGVGLPESERHVCESSGTGLFFIRGCILRSSRATSSNASFLEQLDVLYGRLVREANSRAEPLPLFTGRVTLNCCPRSAD